MSDKKFTVLVVDDSAIELDLTVYLLQEHFNVISAASGEQALQLIAKEKPIVILLDVNMPEMDGYEVCQKIREHDKFVKIIFVSSNNSTQEILKGYDAGGNDYVVKPYSPDILVSKINQAIRHRLEFVQVSQNAEGLAMEAMTSLGELGTVITFLKSSFRAANLDVLADLILGFLGRFSLHACLQLRTEINKKNYATNHSITPIEEELLNRVSRMDGRFAERGTRMFINYDHASLLVKNMPVEDEFKMGRMRDNLAIMLEGADEKLSLLSIEEEAQVALNFIKNVHQRIESENSAFVAKTIQQIECAFAGLGMTEEQEKDLIGLITKSQAEFETNFKDTRIIETQIARILEKIQAKMDATPPTMNADSIDFL